MFFNAFYIKTTQVLRKYKILFHAQGKELVSIHQIIGKYIHHEPQVQHSCTGGTIKIYSALSSSESQRQAYKIMYIYM